MKLLTCIVKHTEVVTFAVREALKLKAKSYFSVGVDHVLSETSTMRLSYAPLQW